MAILKQKTQLEKEREGFEKEYLKFLAKLAEVREKQFALLKEISQKVDQYKLAKLQGKIKP